MRTAIQIVYDDGSVQDIPAPSPVVVPQPPIVTPPSKLIVGAYADYSTFPVLSNVSWIRTWLTVNWDAPPSAGIFEIEQRLHARGYKTLVVFTPPEKTAPIPTDPAVTERWFTAAATAAGGAVDAWEILNEPNLANYNSTYLSCSTCWIKNVLAPAYTALHAANQFVVSGGWSGNPGDTNGAVAWMIKNGLLQYSDAVGHHPYGSTAEQQIGYVRQMRSLIGSKPLWLTEWNLHGVATDPGTWLSELNKAAALVKPEVQAVFYFKLTANDSQAGVSAPFTVGGDIRVPWYDGTVTAIQTLLS